jgi:dolichol-phosphate mannosyltransferase
MIRHMSGDADQITGLLGKKSIAVVTPMANEKETAELFLREVEEVLEGVGRFKIFTIFDKACTDGSVDLVRRLSKVDPRIQLVWSPDNTSIVDAYLRGYSEAIASGADWILEIDAGYSHQPREIPNFIAAMQAGHDCAFGSRFCTGGRVIDPSFRRYAVSKGGTLLTNLLVGTKLHDMTSGFEMFTRHALERAIGGGLQSRGPFFQTEIKVRCRNMNIVEVPISYRFTTSTIRRGSLVDALGVLAKLFKLRLAGAL